MKLFIEGFNYAISGVIHGLKTQRNMQFHIVAAVIVVILSFLLKLDRIELLAVAFAIAIVLISEMLNTSIETIVNMMTNTQSELAKIAKDIGAGAVLIAAINATIVGYTVIYNHIPRDIIQIAVKKVEHSSSHLTFSALLLTIIAVIALKAYFKKGTYLYGGIASGHTAVAFAIWTAISFVEKSLLTSTLVLILCLVIAFERIRIGIHTFLEIAFGAIIGILITIFIFQLLG
ncbi:MAG: diacylglycerol kinase [bacterium]